MRSFVVFCGLFEFGERFRFRAAFVEAVERVAAGDEPGARGVRAVAERAADAGAAQGASGEDVGAESGVGERHAPDPDEIREAVRHGVFGGVREVFLKGGIAGADDGEAGAKFAQTAHGFDMEPHTAERVVRRQIAVGDRIESRPLDVDAVVRAADRGADHLHAERPHEADECDRVPQVRVHRETVARAAERIGVGAGPVHRDADAVRALHERAEVEDADAGGEFQAGTAFRDTSGDLAEEARAVFEGAAERAGPVVGYLL